jgi:restriction endonuclease S subunit
MSKKSYEKELKNIYDYNLQKYYEEYFVDKNLNEAIHGRIRDCVLKLTKTYVDFSLLCDCLGIIIDNKDLPTKYKKVAKETLISIYEIRSDVENIVTKISESITV